MKSFDEVKKFSDNHHPAFAGYLNDGDISELDILATIFYCFKNKYLIPIFEDGDISKNIIGIKKGTVSPKLKFDKYLISELLSDRNQVDSREVGKKIRDPHFKFSMNAMFEITSGIQARDRKISPEITSKIIFLPKEIQESKKFKIIYYLVFSSVILYILYNSYKSEDFDISTFLTFSIFLAFIPFIIFEDLFAKRSVSFNISNAEKIQGLKTSYDEIYQFLSDYPLIPHRITNEFLPFSIAFGIDQSWNKDFGLEELPRYYKVDNI